MPLRRGGRSLWLFFFSVSPDTGIVKPFWLGMDDLLRMEPCRLEVNTGQDGSPDFCIVTGRDVVNAVFVYDVLHVGVSFFGSVLGLDFGLAHGLLIHFFDLLLKNLQQCGTEHWSQYG